MNSRERRLLWITLGVALLAGYFLLAIDPLLQELDEVGKSLERCRRKEAALERDHRTAKGLDLKLERVHRDLSTRTGPEVADELLRRLGHGMGRLKTTNFSQTPDPHRSGDFAQLNVSFDASGDLEEISRMLHWLVSWNEYYRVESLKLATNRGGGLTCRVPGSILLAVEPKKVREPPERRIPIGTAKFEEYWERIRKDIFRPYRAPRIRRAPRKLQPVSKRPRTETVALRGITGTHGDRRVLLEVSRQCRFAKEGEQVLIYKIVEITTEGVRLAHDGKEVFLRFGEEKELYAEED